METAPQTLNPALLQSTANETVFRGRNHNELDCEGFLDFHLRGRRQDATPQEPKVNPESTEPLEKKRSGPLGRFLDDKTQEAFDAINSLIDERLQDIKARLKRTQKRLSRKCFGLPSRRV